MIRKHLKALSESKGYTIQKLRNKADVYQLIEKLRPKQPLAPLIRLGPAEDGGYLLPDDLIGIEALFSPGVDQSSVFEQDCSNLGMAVHLADASVSGPADEIAGPWSFEKKFLGLADEAEFINFDRWVHRRSPGTTDLLLQMDIEGAEYDVIRSMSDDVLNRFRHMIIEFHDLHSLWQMTSQDKFASLNKILRTHTPVHIHANNCCPVKTLNDIDIPRVIEITFTRHNLTTDQLITKLPHDLDRPNVKGKPDITLSEVWTKHGKRK
jgi:hypothetical protein